MSLAAMIAKQKAEQERKANESANAAPAATQPVAAESAPVAPAKAKLNFGIKKVGVGSGGGGAMPRDEVKGEDNAGGAKVPATSQAAAPADAGKPAVDISEGIFSLDDLENTTVDGIESTGRDTSRGAFVFDDEIPTTAPTRDLPDDLTESQLAFVASLNSIYEIVHDPELFGQMVRTIMQEMQENPDTVGLLADQDVHTMLRGLRQSMGLAKIKKAEKATKTRASSKKSPPTAALAGTADAMFNDDQW